MERGNLSYFNTEMHRDGVARSSAEVFVMRAERRGHLVGGH